MVRPQPIGDEEHFYRRIPTAPDFIDSTGRPSPQAFRPRKGDEDGLSVYRARLLQIEDVPRSASGKPHFVAVLKADVIRGLGMTLRPDPLPDQPSHCVIPELVFATRKTDQSREWQLALSSTCELRGPFPGDDC